MGEAAGGVVQASLSERTVLHLHPCIGVYGVNNDLFQVGLTLVIGMFGYMLLLLGFHPAPILLGFVLGPRFEENFRRAMLISRGDLKVFVDVINHPIAAVFVGLSDRRVRRPVGAAAPDPDRAVAAALEVRLPRPPPCRPPLPKQKRESQRLGFLCPSEMVARLNGV